MLNLSCNNGFNIPKGTIVNANVYEAHHNPDVWDDPEVFRPERFLNPDGSCMQRHGSMNYKSANYKSPKYKSRIISPTNNRSHE